MGVLVVLLVLVLDLVWGPRMVGFDAWVWVSGCVSENGDLYMGIFIF